MTKEEATVYTKYETDTLLIEKTSIADLDSRASLIHYRIDDVYGRIDSVDERISRIEYITEYLEDMKDRIAREVIDELTINLRRFFNERDVQSMTEEEFNAEITNFLFG